MVTVERVRAALSYNPITGIFTWAIGVSRAKIGDIAGGIGANGYWRIGLDREQHGAHRLAFAYYYGRWPVGQIDHRDNNPLNNAIHNIRESDHSQNCANRKRSSNNSSGRKGVVWHKKARKWQSQICANGRFIYLGIFDKRE